MLTWIGSLLFAALTFPIGLIIPAYFYVKANGDEPPNQGTLECATVILWGIPGIAAVELGGKKTRYQLIGYFSDRLNSALNG